MSQKFDYDYLILGSGSAGTTAALMAARAGKKVAIIEDRKWGGNTINQRQIPRSACLKFAHLFNQFKEGNRFGLSSASLRFNYPVTKYWYSVAVKRAGGDDNSLLQRAGVETISGFGHFISPYEVAVGERRLSSKKFLIATGVSPKEEGIFGLEKIKYFTTDNVFKIERLPKVVFVIGAGPSGVETAEYFAELGIKVLLADLSGRILPGEDEEVGRVLAEYLEEKFGMEILLNSRVTAVSDDGISKKVIFIRGEEEKSVRVDEVVLATGVKPNLDIGLGNAGVGHSHRGILVNKFMQTNIKHIYAAGSVIDEPNNTTEKANYQAMIATANALDKVKNVVDYTGFLRVVNTNPQLVRLGMSEDDCMKADRKFRKTIVPITRGMVANLEDWKDGFVKILADKQGYLIGATLLMPNAEIVAQELVLAMCHKISLTEIAATPHVATSWSEIVRIAAKNLI